MIYLSFPSISPVFFSIGPLDIRWYSLAYIVGFIFAWRYIKYLASNKAVSHSNSINEKLIDDLIFYSIIGLIIIYIVLTWVFKSWLRPFTIMIMIPLSFIGAVFGHYFLNLTMSILSMFALLALAGIVVNNSIILVSTIERRLDELIKGNTINLEIFKQAVISGVINRLRPVLLTSLTTIGGLSALMFEKSLQAQFLIPMAATIVFGLGITAILVLIVIPSMMGIGKDLSLLIKGSKIN